MPTREVLPAPGDLIRIVPLYLPDDLKAAPTVPPQLTYRNGPLLSSVRGLHHLLGCGLAAVATERSSQQSEPVLRLHFNKCTVGPVSRVQRSGKATDWSRHTHRHSHDYNAATAPFSIRPCHPAHAPAGDFHELQLSAAHSEHALFRLSTARCQSSTGRRGVMPGVLRVP